MLRRQIAAISLLGAEVIGLTMRFDSGVSEVGFLSELVGNCRFLIQAFVVAAAVILLLGSRFRQLLSEEPARPEMSDRAWFYLLGHLGALACFACLTSVVLEGGTRPPLTALALAITWAGMAMVTFLLWIAVWLPPGRWLCIARGGPGMLLCAATAGLTAWGAGRIADQFWRPMSHSTLLAVHWLLRLFFTDTLVRPEELLVGTSTYRVEIAPHCSGFEGIGLMLILMASFLWLCRGELRFPHALILLPLGVTIIWIVNAVRIFGLIALGTLGFGGVAQAGFHSLAGWLGFTAVGLGLIWFARAWSFLARDRLGAGPATDPYPSAPYLVPLIALVTTTMITGAFSDGLDWLYPVRVVASGLCLWIYRKRYVDLRWTFSWESVGLGIAAFLVWFILEVVAHHGKSAVGTQGIAVGASSGPELIAWLGFRIAGTVLTVPLVEELAFRGYLTRRLVSPDYWSLPVGFFSWPSFLVSSAIFGLLHTRWIEGTLSGMIFAIALYRRRELSDAVVAHATSNALIALLVLISSDWSLWT